MFILTDQSISAARRDYGGSEYMTPNLAIFDLDGCLSVPLKRLHFDTLNQALTEAGFKPISYEDHLGRFDGLPTTEKLKTLGVPEDFASAISQLKQQLTVKNLHEVVQPDPVVTQALTECHKRDVGVAVCSNARRDSVIECLKLMEILSMVQHVWTPDTYSGDLDNPYAQPKPSPQMILNLIAKYRSSIDEASPRRTVVFEDSPKGLQAAHAAGCRVVQVGPKGLDLEQVILALDEECEPYVWQWPELQVLIPAAGRGSRFAEAGYEDPKPFIPVGDKRMIQAAEDNLSVNAIKTAIVLNGYQDHLPCCVNYLVLDEVTRGTAETCLKAFRHINPDKPLLIVNSDQILEWDHAAFYYRAQHTELDGLIVTFDGSVRDPAYSYCDVQDGIVKRIVEKAPISDCACTGLWWFKRAGEFQKYARQMIDGNMTTRGEFYISGAIQLAIDAGLKFGTFQCDRFHSLGTPEMLNKYLEYKGIKS